MYIALLIIIPVLLIAISISWTNLLGAPWFPSRMDVVHKMLAMANVKQGDVIYDLGCGDGRTIVTAARKYGARAVGIEVDPLRYIWCQILISALELRDLVKLVYGDIFSQDLSEADVVTCYLLQSTNNKLENKLIEELKPGTRVVSNSFTFPGLHLVNFDEETKLYFYEIGLSQQS
jgi:predicted RNA methylase